MPNYHLYRKAWRFSGAPHEEPKLKKEEQKALLKQGQACAKLIQLPSH